MVCIPPMTKLELDALEHSVSSRWATLKIARQNARINPESRVNCLLRMREMLEDVLKFMIISFPIPTLKYQNRVRPIYTIVRNPFT